MRSWRMAAPCGSAKAVLCVTLFWMGVAHAEDWLVAKCVVEGGWAARIVNGEKVYASAGLTSDQKELRHEYNYKIDINSNRAVIHQGSFLISWDAKVARLASGAYVLHCPSPVGSFGDGFEMHTLMPKHGLGIVQRNTYPADPNFNEKILEDSYSMTCLFVNEN